uniref:Sorting nexin C-terminal domain-containing protein n=1 Tax=Monopterus albus TaxID=43700 RepID=A0A3Q3R2M9_MONAL
MSLSGLESYVKEHESLLGGQNGRETAKQSCEQPGKDMKTPGKTHGTVVADVALNILCLLMKDQWSWLCTENIQKTIRLLFGTFIERWLDLGAGHFTSDSCWVIYLQELQETVADHVAEQVSICLQNHILCFLSMGCCHADIGECLQVLLSDLVTEIYRLWDLIYLCLLECLVSLFSYLKNSQEIPGHTRWSKRRD